LQQLAFLGAQMTYSESQWKSNGRQYIGLITFSADKYYYAAAVESM